jgi:hypothetical protein
MESLVNKAALKKIKVKDWIKKLKEHYATKEASKASRPDKPNKSNKPRSKRADPDISSTSSEDVSDITLSDTSA